MDEETCEPGGPQMAADAAHAPGIQPKAKIFVSYARKDLAFADRLDAALKARGFDVLIDRAEIYDLTPTFELGHDFATSA